MNWHPFELPQELLYNNANDSTVSIIIGENGSGKSSLLGELASWYQMRGRNVIAIANTIYDKFPSTRNTNIHLLRDRSGRGKARQAVKKALEKLTDSSERYNPVVESLRYIGYEPEIGIGKIFKSVFDFENSLKLLRDNKRLDIAIELKEDLDLVESLLQKIYNYSSEEVIWLKWSNIAFYNLDILSVFKILSFESKLKKLGLIQEIPLFLRKGRRVLPLLNASSGELNFISSIIYISTFIDYNSTILIDEPENSLHPFWQKDYIRLMIDMFHRYRPNIIAATHSVLIIAGAEVAFPTTKVYISHNFRLTEKGEEPINIEQGFNDYFHVLTPQNRYLSSYVSNLLENLAKAEVNLNYVLTELDNLKSRSFDEKQSSAISALKELAIQVANTNTNFKG